VRGPTRKPATRRCSGASHFQRQCRTSHAAGGCMPAMPPCAIAALCETVIFQGKMASYRDLKSSKLSGLAGAAPQGRRGQGASRPARPRVAYFPASTSFCYRLGEPDPKSQPGRGWSHARNGHARRRNERHHEQAHASERKRTTPRPRTSASRRSYMRDPSVEGGLSYPKPS
jgi:hypothetical protein